MRAEVYRDRAGTWRWRLLARNHRIVGDSGEGYSRRRDAYRAVKRLLVMARATVVIRLQD